MFSTSCLILIGFNAEMSQWLLNGGVSFSKSKPPKRFLLLTQPGHCRVCYQSSLPLTIDCTGPGWAPADQRCLAGVVQQQRQLQRSTVWWICGFFKVIPPLANWLQHTCLFSRAFVSIFQASIVMCAADGEANFRPHNNRTDSGFPVLLSIVPEVSGPSKQRRALGNQGLLGQVSKHQAFPLKIFLDESVLLLCKVLLVRGLYLLTTMKQWSSAR